MTHILIVHSPYYKDIDAELLRGAEAHLKKSSATFEKIDVPGAFEIPAAIAYAMGNEKYDGFIALGCVIRGETTHYDYVCGESARGIMDLSLRGAAIGYGILTVDTMEQAKIRADVTQGDKGGVAAIACLRMIKLKRQFGAHD